MKTTNILNLFVGLLLLCIFSVIDSADLLAFKQVSSYNDLKCDTTEEVFISIVSPLTKCVTTCLQFSSCMAVFFDQSQSWCQGCTSTTNLMSATGTVGYSTDLIPVTDRTCLDHLDKGVTTSGVYTIRPKTDVVRVYCDMETLGGGWTVFQRRFNGSVNFYRKFKDYNHGFGDPSGEHWLGLVHVRSIFVSLKKQQEAYLEFIDDKNNVAYEHYANFFVKIGFNYSLSLADLIDATDGNTVVGNFFENTDQPFNTYDRDFSAGCPENLHGGWWYNSCTQINPNGHYAVPGSVSSYGNGFGGMTNVPWMGNVSLKATKLMFRTYRP